MFPPFYSARRRRAAPRWCRRRSRRRGPWCIWRGRAGRRRVRPRLGRQEADGRRAEGSGRAAKGRAAPPPPPPPRRKGRRARERQQTRHGPGQTPSTAPRRSGSTHWSNSASAGSSSRSTSSTPLETASQSQRNHSSRDGGRGGRGRGEPDAGAAQGPWSVRRRSPRPHPTQHPPLAPVSRSLGPLPFLHFLSLGRRSPRPPSKHLREFGCYTQEGRRR